MNKTRMLLSISILAFAILLAQWGKVAETAPIANSPGSEEEMNPDKNSDFDNRDTRTLIVAGGCFWCIEPPFDRISGVISTEAGYIGGDARTANYEAVSTGRTGHLEAVRIKYRPDQVSLEDLLDTFWKNIDPTQADGQFLDRGPQYHTAIFYSDDSERELIEASKKALSDSGRFDKPVVTKILPASEFYPAEDLHQNYYQKNPVHYDRYSQGSGRKEFINKTWK